jgi:hypothetical protein
MDTSKMLDPSILYEWFITESRIMDRSGKLYHVTHSRCLTVPEVKVVETFYLEDGHTCEAVKHRSALFDGGKSASDSTQALPLSFKFMAKVSPYMESDGTIRYHFMPTSFTMTRMDKVPSKPSIDEVVSKAIMDKVPYSESLKQLASIGPEYVKEYRKRMSQVGVK